MNVFIKRPVLLVIFLAAYTRLQAQTPANMQQQVKEAREKLKALQANPDIQKKMQQAQAAMKHLQSDPAYRKAMQQAKAKLETLKKTHPELSNVQIPGAGNTKAPGIDSMMQQMSANLDQAGQALQNYSKAIDQTMPKQNLFHHAEKLPALTDSTLRALAESVLKNVRPGLDVVTLAKLDKTVADTSTNVAGTGVFLLVTGASMEAAAYLICQGVLKNPHNPWAANDLGVYLRDKMLYEPSLQCYFYANKLDTGKSITMNTNIGWASAYYGDFSTAKNYFDKALAIDKNFRSAIEGEALLAYREGDMKALLQCLAKEIKYVGVAGGGGGPSEAFSDLCGGVIAQNSNTDQDHQPDPTTDHTYDNNTANNDTPGQDPPPGADVEPVTYPAYRPVFVGDVKQLTTVTPTGMKFLKRSSDMIAKNNKLLAQKLKTLKPLAQPSYTDKDGDLVFPHSYAKFVHLFGQVKVLFDRRTYWYLQKYTKKDKPLLYSIEMKDKDLLQAYYKKLGGCPVGPGQKKCVDAVNCVWIPKLHKSKNSDIEAIARVWDQYSDHLHQTIQWYINATSPLISRVHEEGWNEYLNMKREFDVRKAILLSYDAWINAVIFIADSNIPTLVQQTVPPCRVEISGVKPPDPFSKKPKHIHEFEGKCYDIHYNLVVGSIDQTCHATTYTLGIGPLSGFLKHVDDPLYAQDQNYSNRMGASIGASKSLGISRSINGVSFDEGIDLEAKETFWIQLNKDNDWTGSGADVGVSISAAAKIGYGASAELGVSKSFGIKAGTTVKAVDGQLELSPTTVQITR